MINYEDDMRIDESALDVEWLEQANLAMKYGTYYAQCKQRLTEAEEAIKIIKAELIARANSDPSRYCNKEKPNAADIEAYYRNNKKHKDAKTEWIEAQFECNMAEIAKNEISFTRKAALEQLVSLYISSYFAGPKVPRQLVQEYKRRKGEKKQIDAAIAAKIASKMNRG